jgi:tetratricopeptide (TPR) repeat protein
MAVLNPGIAAVALIWAAAASAHPGPHHDVERLTEQLEAAPDKPELWIARAYYLRLAEQFAAALADLDQARTLSPAHPEIAAHRGLTLEAMGRDVDAERELSRFLAETSGTATVYAARGRIHNRAGRLEQAAADYAAAIALSPEVELYVVRGELLERMEKFDDAAGNYREGIVQVGHAATLRLALVRVEARRGEYAAALSLVDEALQGNPSSVEWRLARGDLLVAAGRTEEAAAERTSALEQAERMLHKRSTAINLVARARVYVALGRIEDARQDLSLAIKKAPQFEPAREMLEQLTAAPQSD